MKRPRIPAAFFSAIFFLAAAGASFAGGAAEKSGETSFKAYLLVPDKQRTDIPAPEAFLPGIVGLYSWSPFTVKDGVPRVSPDASYSTTKRDGPSTGTLGAFRLFSYDMTVVFKGKQEGAAGREIRLSFPLSDITTATGEVGLQPAVWAALEAARRSGKRSGSLRVLEAAPSGEKGFMARVEVR